MPVCCRIQLCCDPPKAATALAKEHGIPQDVAADLLSSYQLVPKRIPSQARFSAVLESNAARERLEALHAHIKAELLEILPALGHPVKA